MMLHAGQVLAPHDLVTAWQPHPLVVLALAGSALLYVRGAREVWSRSSRARSTLRLQNIAFASGWMILTLSLISPIHAWGEALFSAHMAQHELMMVVAAPLLALCRAGVPMMWGLPARVRLRVGHALRSKPIFATWTFLSRPLVAFALHAAAIWVWHMPRLYDASVASEPMHALQHTTFILTALLFWWSLIRGGARRSSYGAAVIYLFLTAVHTTVLGAFLTGLEAPAYAAYTYAGTIVWGLTPLEDQQLGGLIMWVPGGIAYLIAALTMFALWLRASELRIAQATVVRASILLLVIGVTACQESRYTDAANLVGGDAARGKLAIRSYGCGSCHTIPGIRSARAKVGPPLAGIASRAYIGGVLTNSPNHMMEWIQNPQAVDNKTAMPNLGVSEKDARNIATYLYTLH